MFEKIIEIVKDNCDSGVANITHNGKVYTTIKGDIFKICFDLGCLVVAVSKKSHIPIKHIINMAALAAEEIIKEDK